MLSGIPSKCQTVRIQIRPDVSSGLICVQTVCKAHQQTAQEYFVSGGSGNGRPMTCDLHKSTTRKINR